MRSTFNHKEILSAAPDSIQIALGVHVHQAHPLASSLSLRDLAYAAGVSHMAGRSMEDDRTVFAMGLSSGEFSGLLATGSNVLVTKSYAGQNQHAAFSTVIEAKNFKPMELTPLDADAGLEPLSEGAEIMHGTALLAVGPTSARLSSFGKILALSRQAIVNDDLNAFGRLVSELGASAARIEARLVAEAMTLNPALRDGLTVFDLSGNDLHDNVVASVLSGPTLGTAMAKLRTQKTAAGHLADLAAKHLVVAPDLEFLARSIVKEFGLAIEINVLAHLPAGRWFLLGDKDLHPVVATLKLESEPTVLRLKAERIRSDGNDGAALRILADLGATMLGRTGVVRGGVL